MNIRDAVEEEFQYILEQRVKSYEEHAGSIPEGHWKALKQSISSDVETEIKVDRIVAEIEGKIVGSVVLYPAKIAAYEGNDQEAEYPEIRMLAVTPEARGKGVARALISECILRAKNKGYQFIGLHTADYMEGAVRLYERIGFKRLPNYDFQPLDDGIIVKAYRLSI